MDWQNVSFPELVEALREVELKAPRPLTELLFQPGAFLLPKTSSKWSARLKCNLYYYRTNYLVVCCLSFIFCFLRNPLALISVALTTLGLLCLNDPFATALNDQLLRLIKRVHTKTALRLRALTTIAAGDGNLGQRRVKQRLYILWLPRHLAVLVLFACGLFLVWRSAAVRTVAWGALFGIGFPFLHASLRSPNLKARIASAREEFRAVWRGYQAGLQHDYTQ